MKKHNEKPTAIVILGQTATGKSDLAVKIAKKLDGEVISADSRQVYKGMDIGTGKDIPKGFEYKRSLRLRQRISNLEFKGDEVGYYSDGVTRVCGYDLVEPTKGFSVSQYISIANKILKDIWKKKKLPILVGGTGLYIKAVVDGIATAEIPRNQELRESLDGKHPEELFELLASLDPLRSALMNASDRKNPRRLVRAIEIAKNKFKFKNQKQSINALFIGITAAKEILNKRIEHRVEERLKKVSKKKCKGYYIKV